MNRFWVVRWSGSAWENIDARVMYPFSFGNLLDERLDEAYITVYYSKTKCYKSTDLFAIEIFENEIKKRIIYYVVANDSSWEVPVGSGYYKHQIYLLEPTKLLEGIQCQTLTFTNPLGSTYQAAQANATMEQIGEDLLEYNPLDAVNAVANGIIVTPESGGALKSYPTASQMVGAIIGASAQEYSYARATITDSSGNIFTFTAAESPTIYLQSGLYKLQYDLGTYINTGAQINYDYSFYYFITAVENKLPLVPYSVTDAVCRCLELAEPLYDGDLPRFIFDGVEYSGGVTGTRSYTSGQALKYSTVMADELTLTQATLREQLRSIGNLIHAEPRLVVQQASDGTPQYRVIFDEYGSTEEATQLVGKPYTYKGLSQSINEYCTSVRSCAANLVNSLRYAEGTVVDPFRGDSYGYRTLRTDNINVRIDETSGIAQTAFPIYKIIKVMCRVYGLNGADEVMTPGEVEPVDITAYVLERSAYDLKDSFTEGTTNFPHGKNCFLYYTQGEKDLGGLFFKRSSTNEEQTFGKYAIFNILSRVTGRDIDLGKGIANNYDAIAISFQISYIPIYSALLGHSKPKYIPGETPYSQIFSQGENMIETHYFGNNIKGVAARLGNVEQQRTYIIGSIDMIPKAGQQLDGYCIAAVNVELQPLHYKCTLALSKDFNRINQYVGISSHKRVYEVSEREAYNRDILLTSKIVISRDASLESAQRNKLVKNLDPFVSVFEAPAANYNLVDPVNLCYSLGASKSGVGNNPIILPVVSSSFGNTVLFTWGYKDNYSAGERASDFQTNGSVSGYWASDVPYCDYYGRIFKYGFSLLQGDDPGPWVNAKTPLEFPLASSTNPAAKLAVIGTRDWLYLMRKDSRERISGVNVQIEFQTTEDDIIIGPGLARCCPLVTSKKESGFYLYFWTVPQDLRINKFAENILDMPLNDAAVKFAAVESAFTVTKEGMQNVKTTLGLNSLGGIEGAVCWAVVNAISTTTQSYEDEDGVARTIATTTGGEILIAGNGRVPDKLYITIQE